MSKRRKRYRSLGRVTPAGTSAGGAARRRRVTVAMAGVAVAVVLILSMMAGPSLLFGSGTAGATDAPVTDAPLLVLPSGQPFVTIAPIQ
ncbi:MAG: hypothetical protein ACXWOW_10805 [Candidatus Limnocylindrales bacterium]